MGERRRKRSAAPRITVRPRPGWPQQGILRFGPLAMRCALGRSGIATFKREGDGATPLAGMRILSGYFRRDGCVGAVARLALKPIGPRLGWCEVPSDRNYNRPVRLAYAASAERMMRDDALYDICLVLDWNIKPRRRGAGSAIFFHLARPGYRPTEGCVAISARDMARLLPFLRPGMHLDVRRG